MRSGRVSTALTLLALLPAAARAQGGGGEGGGLYDINTGLSVWTLVVFLGLVLLLGKLAWRPILGAVESREERIRSQLDEAAARSAEAARLLDEHKAQLADARRQANEIIQEGRKAGENVRREIEEKARAEAQSMLERARAEIARERDAALETLRRESVDLALAAAARIMQERLDGQKDRALVERYLTELASAEGGGVRA
ncbi:MAG TPA: F0F1 ATP synthase subunit B [Longimicrobiales bacterium]|nr:F0F1 ATP synthase subunit B [Longimicrobiales bacterium]